MTTWRLDEFTVIRFHDQEAVESQQLLGENPSRASALIIYLKAGWEDQWSVVLVSNRHFLMHKTRCEDPGLRFTTRWRLNIEFQNHTLVQFLALRMYVPFLIFSDFHQQSQLPTWAPQTIHVPCQFYNSTMIAYYFLLLSPPSSTLPTPPIHIPQRAPFISELK